MALHLHRATRTDLLAEGLAALLATPPADPFATELVIVPARGVERWLTQRLSHRLGAVSGDDGVCAGVRFLSPNSLTTLLLETDRDDPWLPDQLVWPLLETIDASLSYAWAAPLAAHLGFPGGRPDDVFRHGRRYSVARRLAGLFHSYATQRPGVLRSWEAAGPDGPWDDGAGGEVPVDLAWQPRLWRAVVTRLGLPTPTTRHDATVARLTTDPDSFDLPARVSLFGHTRIPVSELELLRAGAIHREVHLWLPHPSPALWGRLAATGDAGPRPRRADASQLVVEHPLLVSLGRDLRELQRQLRVAGPALDDEIQTPTAPPTSWLAWLQADLRADAVPDCAAAAARVIGPDDLSIQVHACHGQARQVEVLREALVGLLADDESLEPRDILIMCPDVETYAPLIHAAFGLADIRFDGPAHPGHLLRVQLADRSLAASNPLLAVAARLVELSRGRFAAAELLDLAAAEPVRRRFRFDDDDLERFARWVEQAGIRWGLDAEQRADFNLRNLGANTWRFGLDRLLLGVARAEEPGRSYPQVLPVDDVDSGTLDLVGRVAEFVDRVAAFREAATAASLATDWTRTLIDGTNALTEVPLDELWQRAEVERELTLSPRGDRLPLAHSDIRALLAHRLEGRPGRTNFRTGSLTVCTMVPMRSVPHRVIALLGLDDGVFPRRGAPDGDDLLAREPMTGERDARSEDRQLLLDAVCAATETLVITYSGADAQTGAARPPAVPVGEFLDAARAARGIAADSPDEAPVIRHPHQPFDEATRRLPGGAPATFDPQAVPAVTAVRAARSAARTTNRRRPAPGLVLPGRLPARAVDDVTLGQLQDFFADPTRAFLRDRVGVTVRRDDESAAAGIPIELDPLEKWGLGDRLLQQRLSGAGIAEIETAERLRGQLPPGGLGSATLRAVGTTADTIADEVAGALGAALATQPARTADIELDLGGRRLTGTVGRVRGTSYLHATYASLSGKQILETWINHLALCASAGPGEAWTSEIVGRWGTRPKRISLARVAAHPARVFLEDLIELRDLGLTRPLAFAPRTSLAYAKHVYRAKKPTDAALARARDEWARSHDRDAPSVTYLYGASSSLDIWLDPVPPDEFLEALPADSAPPSRFGYTAIRVWRPALYSGADK